MKRSKEAALKAAVVAGVLLLTSNWARADMVGAKMYESTTLVTQSQIDLQPLTLSGAGTVSVKLTDMKWPDLLGSLSFTLFDATHVIGTYALSSGATTGTGIFNVTQGGNYYASIFASPGAGKTGGLYNAQIYYQATAPLPAAGWLLLTGIAGLVAIRPKQKMSQMYA
jgi:hypothetical protein